MIFDENISKEKMKIRVLEKQIDCLEENEIMLNHKIKSLEKECDIIREKNKEQNRESKELLQEKLTSAELIDLLERKTDEIENTKKTINESLLKKKHLVNELQQEQLILSESNKEMEEKISELEESNKDLKERLGQKSITSKELEQEKIFAKHELKVETNEKEKAKNKFYKTIIISTLAIAVIIGGYSIMFAEITGNQYMVDIEPKTSGYTIQNLKGDIIDTYLSWRLAEGDIIRVNVLNADKYKPEFLEIIKKTILSEEPLEIDNSYLQKGPKGTVSIMYEGWAGAMKDIAKTETLLYVPTKFEVIESKSGEGDIVIELTNRKNADGFAGWTNSIADDSQNQILKSRITIFAADTLSEAELETIVRHELGHALGLAHSTAAEDLMYPAIETNFPYISECDIDAMERLYDGGNTSEVVCET